MVDEGAGDFMASVKATCIQVQGLCGQKGQPLSPAEQEKHKSEPKAQQVRNVFSETNF